MRKYLWPCLVMMTALFAGDVDAQTGDVLRIGLYENEPKVFRDEEGEPAGLFVELVRAMADEHDWQLEFVDCEWSECLELLDNGELDLMPDVAYSATRARRFDFHERPVLESFSRVYASSKDDVQTLADLEGMRVATLRNSAQEAEIVQQSRGFEVSVELVLAPSFEDAFEMVADGRADAAISNQFFGDYHSERHDLEPTPIVILPTNLFYAVGKGRNAEILRQIDGSILGWQDDSDSPYYTALSRSAARPVRRTMPRWLYVLLLIGGGVLGTSIVGLFWLRRVVRLRTAHLEESNEEIRQKEARLRMIVEHSPDIFIHLDSRDGTILFANPALTAVLGWEPESVVGDSATQFISQTVVGQLMNSASSIATEPDVSFVSVQHRDGSAVPVEARIGTLPGDESTGSPILQCVLRDLSERENAARELAQSEHRARRIVESLPIPTHVWRCDDDEFLLESVNDTTRDDSVFAPRPRFGSTLSEIFGDANEVSELIQSCYASQSRSRKQIQIQKDGVTSKVVVTVGFLRPNAVIVHFEDITEQAQMEERLAIAQKLETAGILAGGVAHDFNNLLTVINNSAELALLEVDDSDPVHEDLTEILGAGKKAADVTRQLLMFSRSEMVEPTIFSLSGAVHEITKMLMRFVEESIEIELDLCDENDTIFADSTQVEQVILNLALNARDAIDVSGRLIFRTRVDLAAELVILSVEDNGRGMSTETRERAFDPFFTTKDVGKGTGLGLATAFSVMRQSNGAISLESEPGEGTTVTLEFPLADVVELPGGDGGADGTRPGDGEAILLVEDEESVRRVTARMLEMSGFRVIIAENVEDAIRKHAAGERVDLLLTDVVMPGMSGKELADRLSEDDPFLNVLYMSGYTDSQLDPRGVRSGALNLLTKPFSRAELVIKVVQALDEKA